MSLKATDLTFKYFENSPAPVFQQFSATFPKGKVSLITGRSGSGKSSLAYVLAGLYPANGGLLLSGTVTVDNVDIHRLPPSTRVKYVSMMFQNADLQFCLANVEQEMHFCLENIKVPQSEWKQRVDHVLNLLHISHLRNRPFQTLSGGEKQKCALACLLAIECQYLILDEACANIDEVSAKEIIQLLCQLPVTVIAIDHHVKLWEGVVDYYVSLDGSSPPVWKTASFPAPNGAPLIQGKNVVINGISYDDFTITEGSICAVVGASGAGKSTLFKALIGLSSYEGTLLFKQKPLKKVKKKELFSHVGIVFQNPAHQFLALTVWDELLHTVRYWYKEQNSQWQEEKVKEWLALFQLTGYENYSPYLLSQGQQRRLAVLTMIAGRQDVLLMDEPTYGQDPENVEMMMALLVDRARAGLTVIFSTHQLDLADRFAHQIIKVGD